MKHLVIPDIQAKDGVDLSHLAWIGDYIIDKKPDVIICIGDFADMPSLSSYDKGKKSFEGRRYKKDIAATTKAMDLLLDPLRKYNKHQKQQKNKQYKPRMVLTLGNHEHRIMRAIELQAEYDGVIGYHDLPYSDWEVYDFLKPVIIDGILYVHYLANPMSGQPYGGGALNQLTKVGQSFVVGHKQTLDVATRFTASGQQQWGIVAGACYLHDEEYKGYQGNYHWRGVVMLHDVRDGSFDPMFVSLEYLRTRYENK
jgi:hypothetical protein